MLSLFVEAARLRLHELESSVMRLLPSIFPLLPHFGHGSSSFQPALLGASPAPWNNHSHSHDNRDCDEEAHEGHILRMAVPKKKTSHNKRMLRASHKYLSNITHHVECPKCGGPRLLHHLCISCFWKEHKETKRTLGILPRAERFIKAAAEAAKAQQSK